MTNIWNTLLSANGQRTATCPRSRRRWILLWLFLLGFLASHIAQAELLNETTHVKIVRSASELHGSSDADPNSALAKGGTIYICGDIEIARTARVTVAGTQLIGLSDGVTRAKLFLPHGTTGTTVISVAAKDVGLHGLEITTDYPLRSNDPNHVAPLDDVPVGNPGYASYEAYVAQSDYGVRVDATVDASGLVIDGCDIHHVAVPIQRLSSPGYPVLARVRIVNNNLRAFAGDGIKMDWKTEGILIDNNRIWGQDDGQGHTNKGNGIRLSNHVERPQISRNDIARVGRHGIEIWDADTNTNQNNSVKVLSNTVHDLLGMSNQGSFGTSCVGNGSVILTGNSIQGTVGVGIEVRNTPNHTGANVITGNSVENVSVKTSGLAAVGMAVTCVSNALISGNYIGAVGADAPHVAQFGLQILGGVDAGQPVAWGGGSGIIVRANNFVDAGNHMLCVNGGGDADIYRNINISGNTFRATAPIVDGSYAIKISGTATTANLGTIVCRNNVSWYPGSQEPAKNKTGLFMLTGPCTVYTSADSTSHHLGASGVTTLFGESNLRIDY